MNIAYADVVSFPGYLVGTDGSVWTRRKKGGNARRADEFTGTWKRLRQHRSRKGYCMVNLTRDGKNYIRGVHCLVLEAFVGLCPPGMEACHYPNPDKADNHLGNLRWDTHAENMKDVYRDRGPVMEKPCSKCGAVKPAAEFYGDKRASDGLTSWCRKCMNRASWDTADKDRRRIRNREWMRRRRQQRKEAEVG